MLLLFPFFLLLGLFVPGFFVARYLGQRLWWASGFVASLLILFHSIFWLGVFRIPITRWSVLPCLIAAAAAGAAWLARGSPMPGKATQNTPWTTQDRVLMLSSGLTGAVLLARAAISPLTGFDTPFRWDFLAQRMLALGKFDYYPPLTPADFHTYFFVDGIPPLVSFTYWWLYAAAGRYLPSLTCIFVAAQFACTLGFIYGAASSLFSRRAGILAAALLAACPLYFTSVVMGQETGLTALSIAAMIYFIVTAHGHADLRAMAAAGMAAAVCSLSRDYGWIALIAGAVALLWRRQLLKPVAIFAAVAIAGAAPWYVRNWIVAGNPFYSLRFAGFAVNPIHDGILHYYNALFGVEHWTAQQFGGALWFLLLFATLPVLTGFAGGFKRFRAHGYLSVIALILTAVWIQSIGYTSGGMEYSARVLTPALAVLSVTGAGLLEPLTHRARWYTAMLAVIVLFQIWTAAQGSVYPYSPFALKVGEWRQAALEPFPKQAEFRIRDQFSKILPAGSRVLSDSAYLHAALIDEGIEVVPVWSPEVRFIFTSPPEEAERRLHALRIDNVAYYQNSLNTRYLTGASPFYASMAQRWRIAAQVPGVLFILRPPAGKP
jgi:hypothetical protein